MQVELRPTLDNRPYGQDAMEMVKASQSADAMIAFMRKRASYIPLSERHSDLASATHDIPAQYFAPQVDYVAPVVRLGKRDAAMIHDVMRNGFKRMDMETKRTFSHAPSKTYTRQHPGKMAGHGAAKLAYLEALHRFETDVYRGGGYVANCVGVALPSAKSTDGLKVFHRLKE